MNAPTVVSPEEWQAAREELLVKEKQLLRARDGLAAERRRMPWQAVEKEYRFEGPTGELSFADLFDGHSANPARSARHPARATQACEGRPGNCDARPAQRRATHARRGPWQRPVRERVLDHR